MRQGDCLSPFLFSMFINDLEDKFIHNKMQVFKVFLLLYADHNMIFGNSAEELQNSMHLLSEYCYTWKLKVYVNKTKVMIFKRVGSKPRDTVFYYNGQLVEIVKHLTYLGIVFTCGGSFRKNNK